MQESQKITKKDFEILKRLQQGENPPEIFELLRNKVFDLRPGQIIFNLDKNGIINVIKQETTVRMALDNGS